MQLTIDNGSLDIGFGEVAAQSMQEEMLDGVTCTGNAYAECSLCHQTYLRADMSYHQNYSCPERLVTCDKCHKQYKASGVCECSSNVNVDDLDIEFCPFCNMPISRCMCGAFVVIGNRLVFTGNLSLLLQGLGGSGGSGGEEVSCGGGPGQNPSHQDCRISIRKLKNKKDVKLLPNLPEELHPQTKKAECVVRALACMAQLKGADYETAYNKLTKLANKAGYKLENKEEGIPSSEITKIFGEYCKVVDVAGEYGLDNTPNKVAEYIDKGIPLGAICPPQSANDVPHMVTIIGYDNDYYYVAAGNPEGTANYVRKNELMHYGLYNVTSINL